MERVEEALARRQRARALAAREKKEAEEREAAERAYQERQARAESNKKISWWKRVPWRDKLENGEGRSTFTFLLWFAAAATLINVAYLLGDRLQIPITRNSTTFYESAGWLGSLLGLAISLFGLAVLRSKRRDPPGLEIALTAIATALLAMIFVSTVTDGGTEDTWLGNTLAAASAGLVVLSLIRWKKLSGAEIATYWFGAVGFGLLLIGIKSMGAIYAAIGASIGVLGATYLWAVRTRRSTAEIAIYTIGFLFLAAVLAVLAINWTKSF